MARKILIRLGLVSMGLVIGLAIAEVVVRVAGLAPRMSGMSTGRYQLSKNPAIGYEPIPEFVPEGMREAAEGEVPTDIDSGLFGTEQWHQAWSMNQTAIDYRGKANRLGYRDRDHEIAKPPGVYRIVVLGDSIAAGLYIADYENTFPALIESDLERRGIDAEVINLGVNGYNTQQEVETLKDRGLAFSPDLVVLAFCVNDRKMSGNNVMLRLLEQQSGHVSLTQRTSAWLERRSHLYRRVWYGLTANRQPELPPPYDSLTSDTAESYFAELGRLQEEHGFRTLVVSFPFLRNLDEPYPTRWQKERLAAKRWSAEHGLDHLDLLPTLRRCEAETGARIYIDGLHPSVTGHQCAAAATAQHIATVLGPPIPPGREGAGP